MDDGGSSNYLPSFFFFFFFSFQLDFLKLQAAFWLLCCFLRFCWQFIHSFSKPKKPGDTWKKTLNPDSVRRRWAGSPLKKMRMLQMFYCWLLLSIRVVYGQRYDVTCKWRQKLVATVPTKHHSRSQRCTQHCPGRLWSRYSGLLLHYTYTSTRQIHN